MENFKENYYARTKIDLSKFRITNMKYFSRIIFDGVEFKLKDLFIGIFIWFLVILLSVIFGLSCDNNCDNTFKG